MASTNQLNENVLSIIKGRIDPHIYAFKTNTVPNYVKIGDTTRTVEERLDEWRRYFEHLELIDNWLAQTTNGKYFRDLAVHAYLEEYAPEKHARLTKDVLKQIETEEGTYFSKEFFEGVSKEHINEAIADIDKYALKDVQERYQFYSEDKLREDEGTWPRTATCEPRRLQQIAIENFTKAYKNKRSHLLMYAVMRFGKSITALLCAKAMKAKVVLVVSAKVDVLSEWKYTTEAFTDFKGYKFLTQKDLGNKGCIHKYLSGEEVSPVDAHEKYDKVVIFASLQDLSGTKRDGSLKEKFEELFGQSIDLMIVDETHYGARGASYGKVIKGQETKAYEESIDDLDAELEKVKNACKFKKVKVQLHLSGTPYRILMGSEFSDDDIIIKCQYSDIIQAKEDWDKAHLVSNDPDENNDKAGDNPYFGFPQMIRFAFTPSESARQWMNKEKEYGRTCSLDDLFEPTSIEVAANGEYLFKHETEVLDLIRAIDGCQKDKHILDILNLKEIKDGQLCHHMVMVLPYRASCDAMMQLLQAHKGEFKNLGDYELINIAGWTRGKEMEKTNYPEIVKDRIKEAEKENRKTIVLTVGRMLTGVTVPEWDTMLFLKAASSPQEYDQAIYRLQSPYVRKRPNEDGSETKFDMKPQTLLVDFDVNRMFYLQEQKSLISNINANQRGGDNLEKRIHRDLEISPVLMIDLENGRLKKAEAQDVIEAIRQYSAEKSIRDEASSVSELFEASFLESEDIKKIVAKYAELDSKGGLSTSAHKGADDMPGEPGEPGEENENENENEPSDNGASNTTSSTDNKEEKEDIHKKWANFISRILIFALLTKSDVKCLKDVLVAVRSNDENKRIARNIELEYADLEKTYKALSKSKLVVDNLSNLDMRILNARDYLKDESFTNPVDRVLHALRKFGRMSEAEVVTPAKIANEMIALLPEEEITANTKFLDIATKQGEFACAIYNRWGESVKRNIYSIPTSSLAYEFTRRVYEFLDMPLENIIEDFYSLDLIKSTNQERYIEKIQNMKFDVIVGNPPYQDNGKNNNRSLPVYHKFCDIAQDTSKKYISLIMPARWYTPSILQGDFTERMLNDTSIVHLVDFVDAADCFPQVEIKGGVCYFMKNKEYNGKCKVSTRFHENVEFVERNLKNRFTTAFVRFAKGEKIIEKVKDISTKMVSEIVSSQNPFGFNSKVVGATTAKKGDVIILSKYQHKGYIARNEVHLRENYIDRWKLLTPIAGDGGVLPNRVTGRPFVSKPGECCNGTYMVIGPFEDEMQCHNALQYLNGKFTRFLVATIQTTQNTKSDSYQFVPLQDFTSNSDIDWSKSVEDIDKQLYEKYHLDDKEIAFIESMIKPM